jgi:itaconate CoA-transferase
VLGRLIERADVFVQNLSPRAARALAIDADAVHARHPGLIACDLSGFVAADPRKAYGLIQAEVGVLAVTGTPDAPAKAGISIADIAGGMYLLTGILAGLVERGHTAAARRCRRRCSRASRSG